MLSSRTSRSITFAVLAAFAVPLPLLARTSGEGGKDSPPPNVILIVLDDVGLDKLKLYNSQPVVGSPWDGTDQNGNPIEEELPELPNLQRLARNGVRFNHAYAAPVCSASRAQILSGGYGHETGMLNLADPGAHAWKLDPAGLTADRLLPARLQTADYHTGAFGKWHLNADDTDECHPIACGFQVFQGHTRNNEGTWGHDNWKKRSLSTLASASCDPIACTGATDTIETTWDAEVTCADARAFIDRFQPGAACERDRFFAYVAINAPHQKTQLPPIGSISADTLAQFQALYGPGFTYTTGMVPTLSCAPAPGCATSTPGCFEQRLHYRAMLESTDYYIGQLLGSTSERVTDLENTIVLVVGDNGTPALMMQATPVTAASPLNGAPYPHLHAKRLVYEHGIAVPLLAYGPAEYVSQAGLACDGLVSTVDLWATVTEVVGITPANPPPNSQSFAAWMLDPVPPSPPAGARQFVYQEISEHNGFCYSAGAWRKCASGIPTLIPQIYRAVIDTQGWKYLAFCDPTCPCATCGVAASQVGCAPNLNDTYQFAHVFGTAPTQENEIRPGSPPAGTDTALLTEMANRSGP